MKGAIVFLAVFALVILLTFAYNPLPPGEQLYRAVLPNTEQYTSTYALAGTNAFVVIISVFNGVIYGFIAWLIFTILNMATKKDKHQNIQQVVNVNVDKGNSPPPPP